MLLDPELFPRLTKIWHWSLFGFFMGSVTCCTSLSHTTSGAPLYIVMTLIGLVWAGVFAFFAWLISIFRKKRAPPDGLEREAAGSAPTPHQVKARRIMRAIRWAKVIVPLTFAAATLFYVGGAGVALKFLAWAAFVSLLFAYIGKMKRTARRP